MTHIWSIFGPIFSISPISAHILEEQFMQRVKFSKICFLCQIKMFAYNLICIYIWLTENFWQMFKANKIASLTRKKLATHIWRVLVLRYLQILKKVL